MIRGTISFILYVGLALCIFYSGGFAFLVTNIWNQVAGLPPADSRFWDVMLPLTSALDSNRTVVQELTYDSKGYVGDTTALPFFKEAIPIFLLTIAFEVAVCYAKKHSKGYNLPDTINSLSFGVMSQLWDAVFSALMLFPYLYIYNNWRFFSIDVASPWSWWFVFLGVDFLYYVFHRMSHVSNIWWASHIAHHSSERYNLSTALRQTSLSPTAVVFYLPLAFLVPYPMYRAHKEFNLLYQFWIHTEVIDKLPAPIEFIFSTPSHHRVHHGRNPYCIDKNYGGTLIIWDRMLGTFEPERDHDKEPLHYGTVPPLRSYDPVGGNLQEVKIIARNVKRTPGCCNKLSMVYMGPGWVINRKTGQGKKLSVAPIGTRYNPWETPLRKIDPFTSAYLLIHFLVCAGGFIVVSSTSEFVASFSARLLCAIFITASLYVIGMMLEFRRWAFLAEVARNAINIILLLCLWTTNYCADTSASITESTFGYVLECIQSFLPLASNVEVIMEAAGAHWLRLAALGFFALSVCINFIFLLTLDLSKPGYGDMDARAKMLTAIKAEEAKQKEAAAAKAAASPSVETKKDR